MRLGVLSILAAAPLVGEVEFNRDIRPILSDRCFACHGPDAGNRKSKLRLDVEEGARAELGKGRFGVVAGAPERSEVYRRVVTENKALRMPPVWAGHERLGEREIELIRRWIEEGARWEKHWAYVAPRKRELPEVKDVGWARQPFDRYVQARLEREGLTPSEEADRRTLLRRVTLDLTGLPPTPEEVEAFVADGAPEAYERRVERLLESPRYAERMAIRWLEAARYADTNGYQSDGERSMWRWRDWVIDAFRKNMPFDRFTIEQIAGDLLPGAKLEQRIATGFHRNHRTSAEGGIVDEEFRVEYVADRTETTATVWLGLTLGCARCHDHKYDPITQKDFYRMFAFFNNVPEKGFVYNFGNEEPFIKAPRAEEQRRLEELEQGVKAAERRWAGLERKREKEQRRWEKAVRKRGVEDWSPQEGLVVERGFRGETAFDGAREVNLGTEVAKFNHRDPLTLAAWVRPAAARGAILSRMEDYFEGTGYALYVLDGKLRFHFVFRWTDLGLRVETAQPLRLNEWQHVAVTYDGGMKAKGVKMYVDGVEQEMKVLFDQHLWPIDHKAPFRIGAGGGGEYGFRGEIDGVRVYGRALEAEEVAALSLRASIAELARRPVRERTRAEAAKLKLCFLERHLGGELGAARRELREAVSARRAYVEGIPTVMVMEEMAEPRATFVLKRGAYDAPGERVEAGVPAFLAPMDESLPRNRLGLARWLVDRANPLTARVMVNRIWQMLFGVGLVKTVEDFGSQGEWPVYPDVLDWLAVEFMESGWDVKHIVRTMVTSATYRQASRVRAEVAERDPENRLLARGPRFRLPAEMIRDQALAVSGLLVEKTGGPSVRPYQPPGLWQELAGGAGYEADKGEGLYRRSLYTYWRRTVAPPAMVAFDAPTRETCVVRESRTNTPLQALNLMNDVTYLEAARKLAERMMGAGGSAQERVQAGYRLVLGRAARSQEAAVLEEAQRGFEERFRRSPEAARKYLAQGAAPVSGRWEAAELAGWSAVASLILNLDEAVTKQ